MEDKMNGRGFREIPREGQGTPGTGGGADAAASVTEAMDRTRCRKGDGKDRGKGNEHHRDINSKMIFSMRWCGFMITAMKSCWNGETKCP